MCERLRKPRKLWRAVLARLPKLSLTKKMKGNVVKATVIASLLYGCEVMVHSANQIQMLQGFINRVVRGIALKKGDGIKDMKGKMTLTDLRFQVGIEHVEVYIADRTLGWIGHAARRRAERWEYKTLRAWLELESNLPTAGKSELRWSRQVQKWLTRLEELDGGHDSWEMIATQRDTSGRHVRWNEAREKFVDEMRRGKNKDTHKRRHAKDPKNPPVQKASNSNRNDSVWAEIDAILQKPPPAAIPKRVKAEKIECRHCGLLLLSASLHDHEKLRCPALKAQGVIPTAKAAPKANKAPVPKDHIDNEAGTRRQRLDGKGDCNVTLLVCPWCEQKFQRRHQNSCPSMPHARWVDGIREKMRKEVGDMEIERTFQIMK